MCCSSIYMKSQTHTIVIIVDKKCFIFLSKAMPLSLIVVQLIDGSQEVSNHLAALMHLQCIQFFGVDGGNYP